MRKKSIFLKATTLLLLSLIFLSFTAFSASAATTYDDNSGAASPPAVQTAWGDGDTDDVPEPGSVEGLLIVLISLSIVAFGALAFKLFSDRISNKELVILLFVLIFVLIIAVVALCISLSGNGGGNATASLTNDNIFWEVV